jgi:hypothetical protein
MRPGHFIFSPHKVHVHGFGFALTSAACDVVAELSPQRLMSCQAQRRPRGKTERQQEEFGKNWDQMQGNR